MSDIIRKHGVWWQVMGFTRTHLIGVFVTEGLLCTIGFGLACSAILFPDDWGVHLLLGAICSILLAIAVMLASILSLLFYAAWPADLESHAQNDDRDCRFK